MVVLLPMQMVTISNLLLVESSPLRVSIRQITSPPYLQQLLQQSSYMRQNKPIYAVAGKSTDLVTYRNKIYTYTSFIQQPPIFTAN